MRSLLCCGLMLTLLGCSGRDPNWKETVPVTGQVVVDGEAKEGVMIKFFPVDGMDTAQPTLTSTMCDKEGKFAASTYQPGDGAPPGDYMVTFTLPKLNTISMTFNGDELNGKYSDPKKSEFKISVVSETPLDMGRIELKTR